MRHSIFPMAIAAAVTVFGLGVGAAQAHVVIADDSARPGSYFAAFFRVAHGCDGSAMVSLTVQIPDGVTMAKPQPKPGWSYTVTTAASNPANESSQHSASQGTEPTRVTAISWNGYLKDTEFDQFAIMLKLPAEAGPLYFPTIQRCEQGERRWTEIPAQGQKWHEIPNPAPVLNLIAAP